MSTTSQNNKRIAKNTAFLYIRMLVMMFVSLYTSRVVLQALGVVDFGIYNVVGGIVMMLGFLNGTMSTASSRFITVALSHGDQREMSSVFNTTLIVNVIFAVLVLIIAETVGLWFFHEKLQIPESRLDAAFIVYQLSILTVLLSIFCVAYNACIIAHEKMKAFAYIGLFDAFCKLGIAYIISINSDFDKLVVYALLMFGIQLANQIVYFIYCNRNFEESKIRLQLNKPLIKQQYSFILWSSYGSLVSVGFTQGLNVLLNLFFGPAVNAARGISVQVQNAVNQFTANFQTAINPQIIKNVANNEFINAQQLMVTSSKFSFLFLCLMGLPIISETDFILGIWLRDVPEHTVNFVRLMLVISIFSCLANPLRIVNQAEGNIKKFQLYECTSLLTIVPLSYLILKSWQIAELVFIVHLIVEVLTGFIRLWIVLPKIRFSIKEYVSNVLSRILPCFFIPFGTTILINILIEESLARFAMSIVIVETIFLFTIFCWGLTIQEKKFIKKQLIILKQRIL